MLIYLDKHNNSTRWEPTFRQTDQNGARGDVLQADVKIKKQINFFYLPFLSTLICF